MHHLPMSGGESSGDPFVDVAKFRGSVAQIVDPAGLYRRGRTEAIRVYSDPGIDGIVGPASIDLRPARDQTDESGPGFDAHIQLRPAEAETIEDRATKFKARLQDSNRAMYDDMTIARTDFDNVLSVTDELTGATALVAVSTSGHVNISNDRSFSVQTITAPLEVDVKPPRIDSIRGEDVLRGLARIFMLSMDCIYGTSQPPGLDQREGQVYEIGRNIAPIPAARANSAANMDPHGLGRVAAKQREAAGDPRQAPPKHLRRHTAEETLPDPLPAETRVMLDDVGGIPDVRAKIREIIRVFSIDSGIAQKWDVRRPQALLLHGPPGTGKTMLAHALANELGADLRQTTSADILGRYVGEPETNLKKFFDRAIAAKLPTVLLFDEFDALFGHERDNDVKDSLAGVFKQMMDLIHETSPHVFVVATANKVDKIDESLTRSGRFDHKIPVPMPNEAGRRDIILNIITRAFRRSPDPDFIPYDVAGIDMQSLASVLDGCSGADIAEIFHRAASRKALEEMRTGSTTPITEADLRQLINTFRAER